MANHVCTEKEQQEIEANNQNNKQIIEIQNRHRRGR